MSEEYIQFKRGCVYKSLQDFTRFDSDYLGQDESLFLKNRIYRCKKDGTLYSSGGTYKDEKTPIKYKNDFALVGYYDYKLDDSELRKKAMQRAYEKRKFDFFNFDKFYSEYCDVFHMLYEENEKKDVNVIRYIDGRSGQYFNEYGDISGSLI